MKNLLIPKEIQKEIRRLVNHREEEIEWMLADALACKSLADWRNVRSEKFRDQERMHDTQIWLYLEVPFMVCNTWLDLITGQLQFKLERINNEPKIIAAA